MKIYSVSEYITKGITPPSQWLVKRGRTRRFYHHDLITFDTEFTSICQTIMGAPRAIGLLYLWQACIFGDVVMGRTLDEWVELVKYLEKALNLHREKRLVCYVHNLEADFTYLQAYFDKWEVMATAKRAVLRAYSSGIEYRCSYKLTNMSLAKFLKAEGVDTQKQSGDDFDYRKIRTPKTPLSDEELYYGYCDVKGLYEAMHSWLEKTGDDLVTVPYTSTGYVRRDCRNAMRANKRNRQNFQKMQLNPELYALYKEAFRGGNTHANRYHAGHVIDDLQSFDIASSYPACMLFNKYPSGPDTEKRNCTPAMLDELKAEGYGYIIQVKFLNLRTKAPVPYIPIAKVYLESGDIIREKYVINDNGRILYAGGWTTMSILDVDYEIIRRTYEYDGEPEIIKCFYHKMDYLPFELRQVIRVYFVDKTKLKGIAGQEYFYNKAKNKLNSIYGMIVTDIIRLEICYNSGIWSECETEDAETALQSYYKGRNNFLTYQWGVYVTAYARARLQEAIDICGMYIVYCDTDSVKFIRNSQISSAIMDINARIRNIANNSEISGVAYTNEGKEQVIGLWDEEHPYKLFITQGAKKYADVIETPEGDKFEITVSGLSKTKAAKEIGNIYRFQPGLVIKDSGRTAAYYDDDIRPHKVIINGEEFETRSNMAIVDTTYTLGITDLYEGLINEKQVIKKITSGKGGPNEKITIYCSMRYDPE